MTTWQRRVRIGVAVLGVSFAIVVWLSIGTTSPPAKPQRVERLDPKASVESTGGVIRQLSGDKESFRVEFGSMLTYPDGRQMLQAVKILVDGRAGRNFRVTGREANVIGQKQDRVHIRGQVELTSEDGFKATTDEATYEQASGVVRAPGPVAFTDRGLSGTSDGMIYDKTNDTLALLERVVLNTTPSKPGEDAIGIESGAAVFARDADQVVFERGFKGTSGTRRFNSDAATALLVEGGSRMRMLELTGHANITGIGEGGGALKGLSAAAINLEFFDDGRTLSGAVLQGGASLQIGGEGRDDRRFGGDLIDVRLAPDGFTVVSLTARDRATLELPADDAQPARTIRSDSLVAKGEPGRGLSSATFVNNVEYTEVARTKPGEKPGVRTARSRTLAVAVQPGFSSIDDARFDGAVRFDDGPTHASAGQARYTVPKGLLILDGVDSSTGLPPKVNDDKVTIQARHVELTLEGRKIVARGDVRSVMLGSPAGAPQGATTVHRPAMLKSDQPVFATSASLNYDGESGKAVYSGGGRIWQGETAIQGDSIAMDDQSGDLAAHGSVRSVLALQQEDAGTMKKTLSTSIGRADDLKYEDSSRRAVYTGHAHVSGTQGDLKSDRIEVFLKESGNEMDRLEGFKNVTLVSNGRTATGDRLTFFSKDDRYEMTGAPVKIVSECRETTGRALTFYRSADRILVDGKEERRTETKGGAKCGEPR